MIFASLKYRQSIGGILAQGRGLFEGSKLAAVIVMAENSFDPVELLIT